MERVNMKKTLNGKPLARQQMLTRIVKREKSWHCLLRKLTFKVARVKKKYCLEDSGSQVTLVTNRLVESLGLIKRRSNQLTPSGVGDQNVKMTSDVFLYLQLKDEEMCVPKTAYVVSKISNYSPPLDVGEIKQMFPYL